MRKSVKTLQHRTCQFLSIQLKSYHHYSRTINWFYKIIIVNRGDTKETLIVRHFSFASLQLKMKSVINFLAECSLLFDVLS